MADELDPDELAPEVPEDDEDDLDVVAPLAESVTILSDIVEDIVERLDHIDDHLGADPTGEEAAHDAINSVVPLDDIETIVEDELPTPDDEEPNSKKVHILFRRKGDA